MARPIRVEFEGAVYHVMARGNERRAIFRSDDDRKLFLQTVGEMASQFGVVVHVYCLMPNHYHLVVETPRGNLSRAIGWLQVTYTVRFNRRHRRSGHLFQGRFKAQVVEADDYGRVLVRYVHLNPVRPRRKSEPVPVERAGELAGYVWSSHRAYAGLGAKAPWLSLEWLRYWGRTVGAAQGEYRAEMAAAFGQRLASPWEALRGGLVLGAEELWEKVQGMVETKAGQATVEEVRWVERQGAGQVQQRVRELAAKETDERVRIWARVRLGAERGVDVAKELGYGDGSGISQVVSRLEHEAAEDKALRRRLESLRKEALA